MWLSSFGHVCIIPSSLSCLHVFYQNESCQRNSKDYNYWDDGLTIIYSGKDSLAFEFDRSDSYSESWQQKKIWQQKQIGSKIEFGQQTDLEYFQRFYESSFFLTLRFLVHKEGLYHFPPKFAPFFFVPVITLSPFLLCK